MKTMNGFEISINSKDIFSFDNYLFFKNVPYIIYGALSLIFNFINNNIENNN